MLQDNVTRLCHPFGAHAIALAALSSKPGYAGDTVELSHHLDAQLLVSYRKVLLLSLPFCLCVLYAGFTHRLCYRAIIGYQAFAMSTIAR
jgi:hypothetical protein